MLGGEQYFGRSGSWLGTAKTQDLWSRLSAPSSTSLANIAKHVWASYGVALSMGLRVLLQPRIIIMQDDLIRLIPRKASTYMKRSLPPQASKSGDDARSTIWKSREMIILTV